MEDLRGQRSLPWLADLAHDLRYGWRNLARNPGFTTAAVLSLALGVGASTAIFSLINTLFLRPLPVQAPGELVEFLVQYPGDPRLNGFSWDDYEAFRSRRDVLSGVVGLLPARIDVHHAQIGQVAVSGAVVVNDFFSMLGIRPEAGRLIGPEDDRPNAAGAVVAVVSWEFWNSRFNGDPGIVGTLLTVRGTPVTVVGVAPQAFTGVQMGVSTDIWLPTAIVRGGRPNMGLIGRLASGVSIAQAAAALEPIVRRGTETSDDPLWRQATFHVVSARSGLLHNLRDRYTTPLLVLMTIAALLLAVACTNIAGLLLARGLARRHELALRLSLGAGRLRIVRQLLTESLLLSAVGTSLGAALAPLAANTLVQLLTAGPIPAGFAIHVEPDVRVVFFVVGVVVCTGLFFGLAPAWQMGSMSPQSSLRSRGPMGEPRSARAVGKGLIVAQIAVSVVLLSSAGVFLRHLSSLRTSDLGFEPGSVLVVTLDASDSRDDGRRLAHLHRDVLGRLESLPGVRSAALSATTPIARGAATQFVRVEGFDEPPDERRRVHLNWVSPGYFETLGTRLVAGRDFQSGDEGGPNVAIVNESVARYYFGNENPIGRRISSIDGETGTYDIVGVVADAKYETLHDPAPRTIYLHAFQSGHAFAHVALRTAGDPASLAGQVQRTMHDQSTPVRVASITTLVSQMDASLVPERVMVSLSGSFAVFGMLLAAIGLYGLLAYTVTRRTNEIGVRMALGATRRHIGTMVARSAIG